MAATLAEAQQAVLALNSDELPFVYEPTTDGVVGRWNYANQKWVAILGAGSVDAEYTLWVILDEPTATWRFEEHESVEQTQLSAGGDGIGFTQERSFFKGRKKEFKFNLGAALAAKVTDRQGDRVGQTYGYRFSTDEIKQPLIDALTAAGWSRRKGFFARIFGG